MSDLITVTIDGIEVSVPKGTLVVDAAKRIDIDIPVFCYHPKMKPVGMCRMCLVEVGLPERDRETREIVRDEEGNPKINFRGLNTGCTVEVADGMAVRTTTEVVSDARDNIIEFLLTSHPLDCPVCDKGGECPLQNLTLRYGHGTSRFYFEDKLKQDKSVPLGDLIFLDRERCIQCGRCTRFQDEVVDDPVIAFHNRGRHLEIVTMSDPGFDSYWSGNTTDICPVGALTTADFRFGARPWELTPVSSLCPHCPVGCNTTMSTRREAKAGGRTVIKRIMPRQNEQVNEIWICDKGRFVHHFADSPQRLTKPLVRKDGQLIETTWEEALDLVANKLQEAGTSSAGLANDRLSNEDLFMFQKLFRQGLGSPNIDLVNGLMGGGEVIAQVGIASGSNLGELGSGDAILVVASDLHEEAPVWWLRVKQAAERGATVVVMGLRPTRLEKFATHTIRYELGQALPAVYQLLNAAKVETEASDDDPIQLAADALVKAENLVAFFGHEGLSYGQTEALAQMLGNLLLVKQMDDGNGAYHAGRKNNGLIAVWPHGNTQGAWDMGLRPDLGPGYTPLEETGMDAAAIVAGVDDGSVRALYLLGADPVGDGMMKGRGKLDFLVVQEMFLTESASLADVVLPAQSWAEREGTFTSGERRVQRFYPAIEIAGESRADWQILAQLGARAGLGKAPFASGLLFREIAGAVPQYEGMDYRRLARSEEQWPKVGGEDLYYGGNAYKNNTGLGQQWQAAAEAGPVELFEVPEMLESKADGLSIVQIAVLYNAGTLLDHSGMLASRLSEPAVGLHTDDARDMGIADGDQVSVSVDGLAIQAQAAVDGLTPTGIALLRGVRQKISSARTEIVKEAKE